jgi:integrase
MQLLQLVDRYCRDHPYGLTPQSRMQLLWSVRTFEAFHDRPLAVRDFSDEAINAYVDWLRDNRQPDTVRTRRGNLLTLWRWAYQEKLTDIAPRRVRKLRPIRREPQAWTMAEVVKVIEASRMLRGQFRGSLMCRCHYCESLIRAGYDTALRLGDLLRVQHQWITDGRLTIRQSKTRDIVACRLRNATLDAIERCMSDEPDRLLIWPLWGRREALCRIMRSIVKTSGVRPGTFKTLRKSAITALESIQPGAGTRLAGHRSRSTTEQWYIDRSQLDPPTLPPLKMA